jgi:hypothetical protein
MKKVLIFISLTTLIICCRKKEVACNNSAGGNFGFKSYEFVLDTILETDTSFANRDIVFKANSNYSNIAWTIGNDPRTFTTSSVNLKFISPDNIMVKLNAVGINKNCTSEQFTKAIPFVLLDDGGSIKSPLIGSYKGYNTDKPNDTFTVSIKFWVGSRYPWWSNGAYSVDNLPKGYIDSTQNINGISIPEIKGIIASTGYKNIAIDKSGNFPALGVKGYGNLKRGTVDTLLFSYSIIDTLKFSQTGQLSYIKKTFLGVKK